jgi:uncharacterized protein
MKYWIDIFNGPHVHFFQNVHKYVGESVLTARAYKPVPELLDLYGISANVIGKHGGKDNFTKLLTSSQRIVDLARFVHDKEIDIVLHKHSVEAARVAWGFSIPSISFIDNELMVPQNMLVCPLSNVLIAPIAISQYVLRNFTPSHVGILQFDGISEVANVSDFKSDEKVLEQLGLKTDKPIVVLRSEPILAAYNHGKNLAGALIDKIINDVPETQIVKIDRAGEKNCQTQPIFDARSLFYYSDLVISGGGTMTREAALLGTRAITYFEKPLAVDRYLMQKNLLESYPGKQILNLNFKEVILNNKKRKPLLDFEHPFSLIPKAEKLIGLKLNGCH